MCSVTVDHTPGQGLQRQVARMRSRNCHSGTMYCIVPAYHIAAIDQPVSIRNRAVISGWAGFDRQTRDDEGRVDQRGFRWYVHQQTFTNRPGTG